MREPPFRPRSPFADAANEYRRESERQRPVAPLPQRRSQEPPQEPPRAYNPPQGETIRVAPPDAAHTFVPAYTKSLVALTGAELLKRDFPPRAMILDPLLPEKGLAMVFAERGIGKTWVGLNIAHAVGGGGAFLRWRAPQPRRVVYIDGEMPAATIKDRYAAIVAAADFDAPENHFRLVAADLQPDGLPDLADPAAQRFFDKAIADADLIVVDNLSTICRALRENEADSWGPVQSWCLRQRAAGKSVLLIHHAGKGGAQRGTSRKEDVLDSVVSLKRPLDYDASQGALRGSLHQVARLPRRRRRALRGALGRQHLADGRNRRRRQRRRNFRHEGERRNGSRHRRASGPSEIDHRRQTQARP